MIRFKYTSIPKDRQILPVLLLVVKYGILLKSFIFAYFLTTIGILHIADVKNNTKGGKVWL